MDWNRPRDPTQHGSSNTAIGQEKGEKTQSVRDKGVSDTERRRSHGTRPQVARGGSGAFHIPHPGNGLRLRLTKRRVRATVRSAFGSLTKSAYLMSFDIADTPFIAVRMYIRYSHRTACEGGESLSLLVSLSRLERRIAGARSPLNTARCRVNQSSGATELSSDLRAVPRPAPRPRLP